MPKQRINDEIPDDILYHLGLLLVDFAWLKLDYNRDEVIQSKIEKLNQKVLTIIELYQRHDKPIFRTIKNKINHLIATNPNLKGVIVHIENSRCTESIGSIQKFKITI